MVWLSVVVWLGVCGGCEGRGGGNTSEGGAGGRHCDASLVNVTRSTTMAWVKDGASDIGKFRRTIKN